MSVFLIIWASVAASFWIITATCYVLWVYALGYQWPLPLIGYSILIFAFYFGGLASLWYGYPKDWRKSQSFRKRLKSYYWIQLYQYGIIMEYGIIAVVLVNIKADYQWIAAMFVPIIR